MPDQTPDNSSKKRWIKPVITPLRSGMLNKSGGSQNLSWTESIDGVPIKQLVEEFGSPLFVVSEKKLRRNLQRLKHAFESRYPEVICAWSYKTNYLGAVCNSFHQEGAWAEVVSEFEYQKARSLGVPGHSILFNGPFKRPAILETAIIEGARIHIDHLDELYTLEEIATRLRRRVNVSIRLNFDTGFTEPWSRFGFNIENGQARDVAWRIASSDYLQLTGLHSHIGTFVLEPRAYQNQVTTMYQFLTEIEAQTGAVIEYIDIGGGFASANALQGIYLPVEQVVPSVEQYAEAICDTLLELGHEREARGLKRPILILETGRALVDDAESLICSVIANKRLPDGRRAIIVDAGVNLLFTAFWYNHKVTPTRQLEGRPEDTVIYGPLCMNIDLMRNSIMLPPVNVGDTLIFSPVGAYNHTQWLQFIEYRPNVVMIDTHEKTWLIRQAEELSTITDLERLPEHLQDPYPQGEPEDIFNPLSQPD
ncbi:MAG: alanine racemase [Pseudomonadales bacterium]|nr:alanine racemase [Pseudomonadales bacterium]